MTQRTGVGVVGVNPRIRRAILAGIAKSRRGQVAGVVSRDAGKAADVAAEYGGRAYGRLDDLLADPSVEVVFVCTPHHLHFPMARAALEAGKRVICEKPLAMTVGEAESLADLAAQLRRPSLVNFTYHSLPGHRLIAQLLRQGSLGRLSHLDLTYWQARQGLPGALPGNALFDVGSHQVDLARWWCQEAQAGELAEVVAQQDARTKSDAAIFTALARSTDGALVTIQANRVAAGWRNGMICRLIGQLGALTLTFDTDRTDVEVARFGEGSAEGLPKCLEIPSELAVSYADFPAFHVDRLLAALDGETRFPDFADGLGCQRVLGALQTSFREHRWVRVLDD